MTVKIDRILRTNRKTIAIRITEDGEVVVSAPKYVGDDIIMEVVKKKRRLDKKENR